MFNMYSKVLVIFLLALLVVTSPIETRTAPQVRADLASVRSNTQRIDNAILAFSNIDGTLPQALAIHEGVTALDNAIGKATSDVKDTGHVSDSDARNILNDVNIIKPIVVKTLRDAVAKKPGIERLGAISFVKSDLQLLQGDTRALGNALVSIVPASLHSQATTAINSINAAFASAIAAYS